VEINAAIIPYEGKPADLVLVRDITERKKAQEALQISEAKYRDLYENAPDMHLSIDAATAKILRCNQTIAQVTGYTKEEILGRHIFEMYHPDSLEAAKRVFQTWLTTGEVRDAELQAKRKDGSKLNVSLSVSAVRDDQGKILHSRSVWRDITERKWAEEALREAKKFTDSLIASMQDGFSVLDSNGVHVDANPAFCRMTGFSREELIGTGPPHPYWPPESLEEIERAFQKALKCEFGDFELTFMRKDGQRFSVIVSPSWVKDTQGNVISYFATIKDIAERKRAEEALRESEERFFKAFHYSPVAMSIACLPEGRCVDVNDSFLHMLEYTREEVIGHTSTELNMYANPDDRAQMVRIFSKEGRVRNYEFTARTKTGKLIKLLSSSEKVKLRDQDHFISMTIDITERKRAEEALRQSESWYRTLTENLPQKLFLKDRDSVYISCNEHYAQDFRIKPHEITGKTDYDFYPRELAEKYRADDRRIMESGEIEEIEEPYIQDGQEYWVHTIKTPVKDEKGDVTGILGIFHDITERKRAEEALRESEARFRAISSNTPDHILIQDSQLRYLFVVNPQLGLTEQDMLGKTDHDFLAKEDADKLTEIKTQVLQTGKPVHLQTSLISLAGETEFFDGTYVPRFNALGQVEGLIGYFRNVTERRRAEEALQKSEQLYRSLFANMINGVAYCKMLFEEEQPRDFIYLAVNNTFEIQTGLKNVVGKKVSEVIPGLKESSPELFERYARVALTGKPERFEFYLSQLDMWLDISAYSAERGYFIAVFDNITERKRAEEHILHLQQHLQMQIQEMPIGLIVWDMGFRAQTWNPAAERIFGFTAQEALGRHAYDLIVPKEAQPYVDDVWRRLFEGDTTAHSINENITKDGRTVICQWSNAPLKKGGKVDGILSMVQDITVHRRAEEALRESEEKLRLMFQSLSEGITVINMEGKILESNEATARLHGYASKEELIGRNAIELFARRDRARLLENTKRTLEDGYVRDLEYTFLTKEGKEFPAEVSATVLRDISGKPTAFITVTRDITERKRMEEQLIVADRLTSVGELAAGIAHELNNPLTSVIGFSELLGRRTDVPDDIKEDLGIIHREAQRAARVVRNLLTFAGKHASAKEPLNLNRIIENTLELRAYEHRVNNILVNTHFAPDLPKVMADAFQLQQVFLNIIINAEHFMLQAHKRGTLTVTTERVGDMIRASLADDGPGIAEADLGHVFNPFFTTKEVGKGTGLGLSICHGIVTEHGGKIYAQSELGQGATFVVELPILSIDKKER